MLEAKFENDQLFPIRGRSCSAEAMPVRLIGKRPNRTAVGRARHTDWPRPFAPVTRSPRWRRYLSQLSATLFFGLDTSARGAELQVRWLDGSRTAHPVQAGGTIVIRQP